MKLKKIPGTEDIEFKPKFIERYSKLTDWEEFKKYSLCFLRKSIRVNTLKKSVAEVKKRLSSNWEIEEIPWCKEGLFVEHKEGRLDVGNTVEHALGYYYVQEAASMIPPVVLDPKPGEIVLDVCAAPGSKSSQMAQYMQNKGILIANDVVGQRLAALGINLQRCGVSNTVVTQMKGERIKGYSFDKVLLDAPCSGTGTIRKSIKTIKWWNPKTVVSIAGMQKKLILNSFDLLKKGGVMVYSTCSLEPEENEGVVDYLLRNREDAELMDIKLDIKRGTPVLGFEKAKYDPSIKKCLRLWPQDNDTEGFFVAKIKKLYNRNAK
ncbi:RsmB/NOP family class I SAM-dependent RNA methyltransferase [Candidatus Woesearchaeota archaeon]|nr:RsmB/NOP family class I SAM-dependent RNA methyltransferase [Candidatus Woesearchaeota archaeon]MBW3005292.1 RsmB/NOP family class I SAM-dependent RNA methyltransferase [Candidatus Woesearchaeota archaeon]